LSPVTSTGHTSVDIGASANLELVDKFCWHVECGWRCVHAFVRACMKWAQCDKIQTREL